MPPYHTHSPFVSANPIYDHARQVLLDADFMCVRTFTSDDPKHAPESRFEMWYHPDTQRTVLIQVWRHLVGESDPKGFTAYVDWPVGSSIDALREAIK